ncbi:B3 domain-containing transcription factor NGA4-like [Chenopodium quinoa]|uniref:B3 domain-containing transcription factor NGA4-like n=1 Tax=Chenopodium quinoa TaxID=63459 RepID=UPI000B77DBBA|nr:B3 domain-containing transcription factor NGA4-like [Chenopodium quinoa]
MELLFSKKLTPTDVGFRLSWPRKHLDLLRRLSSINLNQPPNDDESSGLEFQVYDMEGRSWTLTCTTRSSIHPKPVISRGWRRLVKDNGLRENDEIKFYKNLDPGSPIFIHVTPRAQQG